MEAGLLLSVFVLIAIGLTNLFCLFYVLVKMYKEKGILHALFGFFCCQLYPFIWGWLNASRLRMYDIMVFWTVIVIFSFVLQLVLQLLGVMPQSGTDFSY